MSSRHTEASGAEVHSGGGGEELARSLEDA
jgi:hypothetical protein